MMYMRVIPRDLFNEAKLLKCMGMLYLASERVGEGVLRVALEDDESLDGFQIMQNPDDGSISVVNVMVLLHGQRVHCFTPLNSRRDHPLYARWGDVDAEVFDAEGRLTDEFLELVK